MPWRAAWLRLPDATKGLTTNSRKVATQIAANGDATLLLSAFKLLSPTQVRHPVYAADGICTTSLNTPSRSSKHLVPFLFRGVLTEGTQEAPTGRPGRGPVEPRGVLAGVFGA